MVSYCIMYKVMCFFSCLTKKPEEKLWQTNGLHKMSFNNKVRLPEGKQESGIKEEEEQNSNLILDSF